MYCGTVNENINHAGEAYDALNSLQRPLIEQGCKTYCNMPA